MQPGFSLHVFEKIQIKIFIKSRPVGAELPHTDGRAEVQTEWKRTDMLTLLVAFRNFANAPKNKRSCENAINIAVILLITEKFRKGWRE
jgi:hypothetical protein